MTKILGTIYLSLILLLLFGIVSRTSELSYHLGSINHKIPRDDDSDPLEVKLSQNDGDELSKINRELASIEIMLAGVLDELRVIKQNVNSVHMDPKGIRGKVASFNGDGEFNL